MYNTKFQTQPKPRKHVALIYCGSLAFFPCFIFYFYYLLALFLNFNNEICLFRMMPNKLTKTFKRHRHVKSLSGRASSWIRRSSLILHSAFCVIPPLTPSNETPINSRDLSFLIPHPEAACINHQRAANLSCLFCTICA